MSKQTQPIRRAFFDLGGRQVHAAICGQGFPVFLLHQTPRSWDEYRDVLPLIGRTRCAIAMDTPGFGESDPLTGEPSIEGWAETVLALADVLEVRSFAVVGHHTGAVIAAEVAAQAGDRVAALVLSACSYVDAARRLRHADHRVIDDVETREDGAHLTELWNRRRPFYPADRPDLLRRFIIDALRSGAMAREGHRVVNRYQMETRIGRIHCPTLVLAPDDDPNARDGAAVSGAIRNSVLRRVPGAKVPFPDHMPNVFAELVTAFLDDQR